jgi:hypothetical protein
MGIVENKLAYGDFAIGRSVLPEPGEKPRAQLPPLDPVDLLEHRVSLTAEGSVEVVPAQAIANSRSSTFDRLDTPRPSLAAMSR